MVHLTRTDPARNMARRYNIDVQPGLFGDWSLVIEHGRIGGGSRLRCYAFADEAAAWAALAIKERQKRRRGYQSPLAPVDA